MAVQTADSAQIFLEQIKEDIALIRENYLKYDANLSKDEYAKLEDMLEDDNPYLLKLYLKN